MKDQQQAMFSCYTREPLILHEMRVKLAMNFRIPQVALILTSLRTVPQLARLRTALYAKVSKVSGDIVGEESIRMDVGLIQELF